MQWLELQWRSEIGWMCWKDNPQAKLGTSWMVWKDDYQAKLGTGWMFWKEDHQATLGRVDD